MAEDRAGDQKDTKAKAEPTFEAALGEVEAIIERIETGQSGLEKSIGEYEKGVRLLARCRSMLEDAEQRIEDVTARLQDGGDADRSAKDED
ncbi:MAG: exodeoxyribonuclease VII small subunit [Phycisphaerales bacterium]|nr:exodeoxyribonuclease VII small subunit [Phycisphaerales bacterium]